MRAPAPADRESTAALTGDGLSDNRLATGDLRTDADQQAVDADLVDAGPGATPQAAAEVRSGPPAGHGDDGVPSVPSGADGGLLERLRSTDANGRVSDRSVLLTPMSGRDDPMLDGFVSLSSAGRPVVPGNGAANVAWTVIDRHRVAELRAVLADAGQTRALDEMREHAMTPDPLNELTVGASTAVAGSFSVGYVLWILRGGVLLTGLMSSLPAWQMFDPTPILGAGGARRNDDEHDDPDDADAGIDRLFSHECERPPAVSPSPPPLDQAGDATARADPWSAS